jgi:hypothetical protein
VAIADDLIMGLSAGGIAVARMEFARLGQAAIAQLNKHGRAAKELARITDAALRSDEDLATELDQLTDEERQAAGSQLHAALTAQAGSGAEDQSATAALTARAVQLRQLLVNHGIIAPSSGGVVIIHNGGQVISNTGDGPLHAPFRVGGDYHAGSE